ncbi:MAG: DNA polymerase III subunit delta [Proteobacteria bacterium]|nr:DNA polymerase III subunit delta [Pseudomonadota bacterium]
MTRIYFIFGNQSLEIEETTKELIHKLLPEADRENSVFHYDVGDFVSAEQSKTKKLLGDFQSTCETVSFFSPKIVVHLQNLQKIATRKSPTESIKKSLQEINLVKIPIENDTVWFDGDTLSERLDTHHHITGEQIVQQIVHYGKKSFYLELDPAWRNRMIYRQKGKNQEVIEIGEYLESRLKAKISFAPLEEGMPSNDTNTGTLLPVLKAYLENPPEQVEFIYTAHIRNTRELNKEIYGLLNKHAKEIRTTVAYDDFRPHSWVIERARKRNLVLDQTTADLLIEIAGTEFSVLDMELRKLEILLPPDTQITPEYLLKSTSHSKRFNIFRVANFLVQRDLKNTLECLELILKDHPSDSVNVFGLIAAQFRRLLKISWMQETGIAEKTIVERLKINQWVAKQAIKHSRSFTVRELENIVVHLAKSDLQIKYYAKDALAILENICFLVCQGAFKQKKHIDRHWLP